MNTKFKIILFTIIAIFAIRSFVMYNEIEHHKKILDSSIQQQVSFINRLVNEKKEFMLNRYTIRLQNILEDLSLSKYIYEKNSTKVSSIISKEFLSLQREDSAVRTLHLIDKNNITVYRAHKPSKKGDDLSKKRPIVVETNKTKEIQYGYEDGIHDVNFRIDIPVSYKSSHLGVLEIGLDISLIAKKIESIFYSNYVLVLLNEKNLTYYKPNDSIKRFKDYLAIYIDDNLYKKSIDLSKDYISIDNKTYYVDDTHYLLTYNHKDIGKMVHLFDITDSLKEYEYKQDKLFIQTIVIVLLLIAILYTSFTYYENQINEEISKNHQKDKMLLQQGKLAIMGEMISMIAHQWRQPLSAINMHAQSIAFKKKLGKLTDDMLEEKVSDIKNISFDMSKTIDDFKNFFKPNKKKNLVNIKNSIEDSISLISAIFKNHNIDISIKSESDISISIYDREFSQVVINILNNAKDALIDNKEKDRKILIVIEKRKSSLYVSIEDNAGGIPDAILDKVFDPYFSTKSKNGTGLGLYMSKIIIDEHLDGLLSVKNSDKGAVFTIRLPIV